MKVKKPFLLIFLALQITPALDAATLVDGSTSELAAYSARQILTNGFAIGDGIYWMDEDMGLGSPFQAYADMTMGGGGWTLGVVSLDSNPAASITISAQTGTASPPFGASPQ